MEKIQTSLVHVFSAYNADLLNLHQEVSRILTFILFDEEFDVEEAKNEKKSDHLMCNLKNLAGPRQVCQYQFKMNDIVWICKQCQKDETCVLCNDCYQNSCHVGHDVFFYHSAAGGCCDCGDHEAWDSKGFCSSHGNRTKDPLSYMPVELTERSEFIFRFLVNAIEKFVNQFASRMDGGNSINSIEDDEMYHLTLYFDDFHTIQELEEIFSSGESANIFEGNRPNISAEDIRRGSLLLFTSSEPKNDGQKDSLPLKKRMVDKAQYFLSLGLRVAVFSNKEMHLRECILSAMDWMQNLAYINDGMCKLICIVFNVESLTRIMKTDVLLDKKLSKRFHNLLMTLMADQPFKMKVAVAYSQSYATLCELYGQGFGLNGHTLFSLSVQFLNREQYVSEISYKNSFLTAATKALSSMLLEEGGNLLVPTRHKVLSLRRYNPIISDLKIVFIIPEMARFFVTSCSKNWLKLLRHVQYMQSQVRSISIHLAYEDKEWTNAFNLCLSFSSIFDHLTTWFSLESSTTRVHSDYLCISEMAEDSDLTGTLVAAKLSGDTERSTMLMSVDDVLRATYAFIVEWQNDYLRQNCVEQLVLSLALQDPPIAYKLYSTPVALSFHLPLHRYFTTMIQEALKYPHHSDTIASFVSQISNPLELSNLIDFPLCSMLLSVQIKIGMWRRNGVSMLDQLMNYAEVPFCRVHKDLDLLLIQLAILQCPSSQFINQLFHRFSLLECLRTHQLDAYKNVNPLFILSDLDYISGLLDECFRIIINICTELPPPVNLNNFERLRSKLRREIVHKLICGPATYSQIQECFSIYSDHQNFDSDVIESLIEEVADKQLSYGLKPPTFSLKRQFWKQYDPSFPHMSNSQHQTALELRPKLVSNEPYMSRPLEAHSLFASLREKILLDSCLLSVIRDLILTAAAERTDVSAYRVIKTSWTVSVSESVYARLIQIFTLIIHVVLPESTAPSFQSENDFLEISAIDEQWSSNFKKQSFSSYLLDELAMSFNYDRIVMPSLLCALMDLKSALISSSANASKLDDQVYWLGWIIDRCESVSEECCQFIRGKSGNGSTKKALEMEERKRLTREKAMEFMKTSADNFKSMFGDISDSDEEEEDDVDGTNLAEVSAKGSSMDVVPEKEGIKTDEKEGILSLNYEALTAPKNLEEVEELTCIICHGDANTGDSPMGYYALCTASTVLMQANNNNTRNTYFVEPLKVYNKLDTSFQRTLHQPGECNMHLLFCGHSVHYSCHDEYAKKNLPRSPIHKSLYLDVSKKNFHCPLCKKLNNILIPSTSGLSFVSSVSKLSVMEWIQSPIFLASSTLLNQGSENQFKKSRVDSNLNDLGDLLEMNFPNILRGLKSYGESSTCDHYNNFLRQLSETVFTTTLHHPDMDSHPFHQLYEHLEIALSGVAYTLCCDVALMNHESGMDVDVSNKDTQYLHKVVDALACVIYYNDFGHIVNRGLALLMNSDLLPQKLSEVRIEDQYSVATFSNSIIMEMESGKKRSSASSTNDHLNGQLDEQSHWLAGFVGSGSATSLLSVPLLDYLVLAIAVAQVGGVRHGVGSLGRDTRDTDTGSGGVSAVACCYPWVCVAQLVQVMVTQLPLLVKANHAVLDMFHSAGSLAPLLRTVFAILQSSSLSAVINSETVSSDRASSSAFVVETVLLHWTAFLGAVENLLLRVPFCKELVRNGVLADSGNKLDIRIARLEGLQSLLALFPTHSESIEQVVRGWVDEFVATKNKKVASSKVADSDQMVHNSHEWTAQLARQFSFFPAVQYPKGSHSRFHLSPLSTPTPCYSSYPCVAPSGPQLIELPREYTQLHSAISSLCEFELPALCLVCGAIINASGSRQCCLHTLECGGEAGIFFLLQDCSVLLCHGFRCSYFRTPYVDKYGEGHQNYRGKPLHLDLQIYNAMRKMWASHNIPWEVFSKRTSSPRMIILGYY